MPGLPPRLEKVRTALVVVDMQEKFRPLIAGMDEIVRNCGRLIRFCDRLDLPIVITEQYPQGLGRTLPELAELVPNVAPIEKVSFSCAGDSHFTTRLQSLRRDQVVLCGIETHVCVYQTAYDLRAAGLHVALAADAIGSRLATNREIGLARMRELGAQLMSTEMIMFEILRVAGTPDFKAVADVLRG